MHIKVLACYMDATAQWQRVCELAGLRPRRAGAEADGIAPWLGLRVNGLSLSDAVSLSFLTVVIFA